MLGCGASAQIVSSCHGVSEQYCIFYKNTHDKLCILLKYNLPVPRAVTLLFADSAQILLSAPSRVRTLILKRRKQSFFGKTSLHGIRTHVSRTELWLSYSLPSVHYCTCICDHVLGYTYISPRYMGQGC